LVPGWIAGGEDIGRWAQRHARPAVWARLRAGQLRQLRELGVAAGSEDGAAVGGEGGVAGGVEDGAVEAVGGGGGGGGGEGRGGRAGAAGNGVEEGVAAAGGDTVGVARAHRRGRGAWETAFAAAVAYRQREGDLEVPRAHIETVTTQTAARADGDGGEDGAGVVDVRLGKWVNNQRTRRGSLSEERVRLLTQLGIRW